MRCVTKIPFFLIGAMLLSIPLVASPKHSLLETEDIHPSPIRVGEVLTYKLKIHNLPAGIQITKVAKDTVHNGHRVHHFTSESKTSSIFTKLYHFRDKQQSYVTTNQFYPVHFTKNLEDNKYRANVEVNFDFEQGKAQYSKIDFKQGKPKSKKQRTKAIKMPTGTQNELSMVYFVRSKKLKVGQTYTFPVLVKDKVQEITLTCYRREMMKINGLGGQVETLALRTSHGYLIWLTNDERRIPVRVEAKIPSIGKLIGTLEKIAYED